MLGEYSNFYPTYIYLLYKVVIWYMVLEASAWNSHGLVLTVVGAGARFDYISTATKNPLAVVWTITQLLGVQKKP